MFDGQELGAPGLLETGFSYMLPWVLGLTDQMPVKGSVTLHLPGLGEDTLLAFVVNGAPDANTDLAIAQETLTTCGFRKSERDGIWRLEGFFLDGVWRYTGKYNEAL